MKIKLLLALLIAFLAVALLPNNVQAQKNKKKKPNVLFIMADDLRTELGCYGVTEIQTPNIDRLARKGMAFTNAFCQVAICAPTRAAVMTGLRPDSTGVWTLREKFREEMPDVVTIPQQFKKAGYHTVSVGKIFHNHMPDSVSFDEPDLRPAKYITKSMVERDPESFYFDDEINEELAIKRQERLAQNPEKAKYGGGWAYGRAVEVADCPDDSLYDGAQTTLAINKLREIKNRKEPFFMALGYYRPHLPFVAPKKYWDLYDPMKIPVASNPYMSFNVPSMASFNNYEMRGCYDLGFVGSMADFHMPDSVARVLKHGYYASVSYMDAQVGRILDELEKSGLMENTIIVFWGDHGWKLGEHNGWSKFTNYLNDTRVPLIVYAPDMENKGDISNELVEAIDIYPTLLDLAGVENPGYLQGLSFKKVMNEKNIAWKSAVFNQFLRLPGQSIIPDEKQSYMGYSMVTKDYHYVEWYQWDGKAKVPREFVADELYDLKKDPKENINISIYPENKAIKEELSLKLKSGWRGVADELANQ